MIQKVLIVGAGVMGAGIAQICAQSGLAVALCDNSPPAIEKARASILSSLGRLADKEVIQGPVESIFARIAFHLGLDDVPAFDIAIESVPELPELKRDIIATLDKMASPEAILATNASAIAITRLASATTRPDRFLGLHFFNPVPMLAPVEVVRGPTSSDATFEAAREFVRSIGKIPIAVHRDIAGSLLNRINLPSTLEAIRAVEQGVGSIEDIDMGVRLAFGRRMGIFETGDLVGLDVTLGALTALHQETGDPRWEPPTLLKQKVERGELGRKTGRGWYEYLLDGTRREK
jgi:3-hydroxybutyryl-CoA dehydrogenase